MTAELAISGLLGAAGFLVLLCLRADFRWALVWLSLPVGAAIYLAVALVLVTTTGTLRPEVALAATGTVGVGAAAVSVVRSRWDTNVLIRALVTLLVIGATVILARSVHLTRLTRDSVRYLVVAADLQLPNAASEALPTELLTRQMGLPSLHALSSLIDRRYFTSIGPLFGVSGLGFFVWFCWRATQDLVQRHRWFLVLAAALFVGSSNRMMFDMFYINSHIEVAAYMFIAIGGSWLAATTDQSTWMVPAGLAIGATLVFRPEAPLVAAIVLVAAGATHVALPERLMMIVPTAVFGSLWYGIILWRYAPDGDTISLTAPVFGSLVVLAGAVAVVLAGGARRLSRVVSYADRAMLVGLAIALIGLAAVEIDVFTSSLAASFQNIALGQGAWLFTWSFAVLLLLVAFLADEVPKAKLWITPIVGFGIVWFLLPIVRDTAWRVGTGDSGNRILAHMLLVVVGYLVLAASSTTSSVGSEPGPRVAEFDA